MLNDLFDFIMFLIIDEIWGWSREVPSMNFIFMIRRKKRSVEYVVNFPRLWESEFVGDGGEYFCDGEWSFLLGSEFGVRKGSLKVSSLQPYPCSLLEGLEVSPGLTFHGLSGEIMGG